VTYDMVVGTEITVSCGASVLAAKCYFVWKNSMGKLV